MTSLYHLFVLFSCLTAPVKTPKTILTNRKRLPICPMSILKMEPSFFPYLELCFLWVCPICLYSVRLNFFCSQLQYFYHERILDFVRFFCVSMGMTIWLLSLPLFMCCIHFLICIWWIIHPCILKWNQHDHGVWSL